MKIVIQCAASKRPKAGDLLTQDGKPIDFVAHPEIAPTEPTKIYARPDDISDCKMSWREQLRKYNENQKANPLGLMPAYEIYENNCYRGLVKRFGLDNVYVLSAGWGLIRSDFLTPYYDITFNAQADAYKRRRTKDRYNDFNMLPNDTDEQIVFLGPKDYRPLFYTLTDGVRGERKTQ